MKKDMSGFTIHEMENVARSIGPQDGMPIDIGIIDMTNDIGGDSLGLGMLANNVNNSINSSRNITIDNASSAFKNSGPLSEIEFNNIEPIEPITLNLGSSMSQPPVEIKFSKESNDYKPSSNAESSGSIFSNNQSSTMNFSTLSPAPAPRLSAEEEQKEKMDLVNKLQRLESKGFSVSRRYTMDKTLYEMKN